MYLITQNDGNLVIKFSTIIEAKENSFIDDENVEYTGADYQYFPNVDNPGGVKEHQYSYTPEEGFKIVFTTKDLMEARIKFFDNQLESERYLVETTQKYHQFCNEKENIETSLKFLSNNSLSADEKIALLENVVCDLYEALLALGGE